MQEQYLYEYAVIRVVPRVEREEFFNAGLILFSKEARYIKARTFLDEKKWALFCPHGEIDALKMQLSSFESIAAGKMPDHNIIASYDIAERFRWLTAVKSATLQTSRPHPGFTSDPEKTFETLFRELVLPEDATPE